ncbi:thiamine pyrophosphate-dependent enzyme [Paracraurococcus lichenis]|uniref:Thiamine pyrophosphate-binding protein n=1 Tax=Paracraurococcus lichenis TaxID=3064888 RepID=A0ABT9DUD7_9PROT|nr:thiamine pyrophosphate-dependent enzyme [Paracraurococcus sp. LOR1-02]MDO9707514.1 thiamine pyrophosphate-binding protein [Paracraurococcus sp. LOR1-02]
MPNASEIVIDTLHAWGVDTIFGLAGDGINGVVEALRTRQDRIRFVPVRHEESAAFMAAAYAKWTGRIGCCFATTGPGGLHLLNGLYDAKLDLAPVVALTGLPYHDLAETFTQQDVPLDRVFADVAVYNARVMGAQHAAMVTSLACRSALARHGVAHLALATDVQEEEAEEDKPSPRGKAQQTAPRWQDGLCLPDAGEVGRAAEILNGARRVAILAGRGALEARAELEQTAQMLGAPVAKALLGKAVLPDDHPYTTGGIGYYGTFGTHAVMAQCDALLIVGSTFPYAEYYPKPGQARVVQIDRDPQRIGLRQPAEAGLVGDARAALEMLNAQLRRKEDRGFLEMAQAETRRWYDTIRAAETSERLPMNPSVPVAEFGRRLPPDAVVVADSGHHTGLVARHIRLQPGHDFGVSGLLASMACAIPYAVAAGCAFPGRPIFGVIGDGGLSMQLGEFATAVEMRLPLKLLVLRNGTLGQIKWEQMLFLGNPDHGVTVPGIDFAKAAEAMGARGFTIERPEEAGRVLEEALAAPGPALIQAIVDGNEPLLPAVVSDAYAAHLKQALDKGGRDAAAIREALAREPALSMMAGHTV